MPRICTICLDPQRAQIEQAFAAGVSRKNVAERFGISAHSMDRHVKHGHTEQLQIRSAVAGIPFRILSSLVSALGSSANYPKGRISLARIPNPVVGILKVAG